MGYDDPVKAFKVSLGKQQYKCPICIVGSTYDAIHLALKALEKLSKPVAPAEGGEVQFDGDAPANVEVQDVSGGNVSAESHATSISNISHVSHVSSVYVLCFVVSVYGPLYLFPIFLCSAVIPPPVFNILTNMQQILGQVLNGGT